MTYLVLARKWRPRSFDTLVGQDHVVRALTHALVTQRLHHAWLFTGTRGVGKTTLSRILAKSLNCETGITSRPCGVCRACTEIDAGRFVDYLELDAASNRGVDEMTQLLEQAVYAPGAGRFKVYMIDEVHMLTGHAFNAMLKTLEEPPPHVKFILATTDPQKIPVTVLSRCLQFNLKQMPPDAIVGHLRHVLGEEQLDFEVPALRLIAQAAAGSMRDALSLTDQAIAYSAGNLTEEAVRGMLGTIDQRHLVRLLDALSAGEARAVLAVADELAMRGLSYSGALADLAGLLSRVAIEQRVAGVTPSDDPLAADIARLARSLHPDAVQLFYSVAVHSRGELALAPDEYAGFVMACLRMLSLHGDAGPQSLPAGPVPASAASAAQAPAEVAGAAGAAAAAAVDAPADTQSASAAVPAPSSGAAPSSPAPVGAAPQVSPVRADASFEPAGARDIPESSGSPAASPASAQISAASQLPGTESSATSSSSTSGASSSGPAAAGSSPSAPTAPASTAPASTAPASTQVANRAASAGVAPWEDAPAAAHGKADEAPSAAGTSGGAEAHAQPNASVQAAFPPVQPDPPVPTEPASGSGTQAASPADRSPTPASAAAFAPTPASAGAPAAAPAPTPASAAAPAAAPASAPASAAAPVAASAPAPTQAPPAAAAASPDPDGPPAWVDEVIPDDAEGGYLPPAEASEDGFIASPDDEDFETVGGDAAAAPAMAVRRVAAPAASSRRSKRAPRLSDMSAATWPQLAASLPVTGLAAELARQSEWQGVQGDTIVLRVAVKTLADSASRVRLQTVLCEHFGQSLRLEVMVGATGDATAHAVAQQERAERQRAAEAAVEADPFVQALLTDFGGRVVPGSIRHVDPPSAQAR
ncbi:DNA polymerase III, subunit gamma and tau [Bordetella genomosp. 9]|uniref:DNA polymerase III subunit gamma/tau n=1 Tax=Bordetella genomosp. 9 TaxID=1416803 RepID=UPI000A29415D|nr:DNA polymerase III subunit gamma/tau [Bordetella genomosp. 9]ARP91552.1 DNA polymerase III, subunit gamma and tau [Bordetella genomosp. 9]